MHGLRVIDGGGHYSFDLVGFYDLFYRHFLIWKNSFCVKKKKFTFLGTFCSGKNSFLTHISPPPPRKERLVISHSYHVLLAGLSPPKYL